MAAYQYTKAGADAGRLHVEIMAAGLPVDTVRGPDASDVVTVFTPRDLTAPEQTTLAGVVTAHVTGAAGVLLLRRLQAKALLDRADVLESLLRAIVLLTVDEINDLRGWLTDFKVEVAAATSLADLKTRVATLPDLVDRTATQARNAIKAKIDDGDADV